jgi:hypothetical protein
MKGGEMEKGDADKPIFFLLNKIKLPPPPPTLCVKIYRALERERKWAFLVTILYSWCLLSVPKYWQENV